MPRPKQADGEIHEDQLLDFLVNTLTGAFSLNLGENVEIDPDNIFVVLVGACADGISYLDTLREQQRRVLWD